MIPRTNEKRIPRTKEKRGALQKKSGMVARTFADQFPLTYWGKKIRAHSTTPTNDSEYKQEKRCVAQEKWQGSTHFCRLVFSRVFGGKKKSALISLHAYK